MLTFQLLVIKILPLYALILLGFYAAKKLKVERDSLGRLLLYIISPVILFYGGLLTEFNLKNFSLPVIIFIGASTASILFYKIGKLFFPNNSDSNLLAYSAGASNTGYFGLPVIAATLGNEAFAIAIIANLGMIIYEYTLGFYLAAKGNYSAKQSLIKIIKLPHLYALLLGFIGSYIGLSNNQILLTNFEYFKGAYTLLGMMIIGMGLANMKFSWSDYQFVGLGFIAKFICLPIFTLTIIWIDQILLLNTELNHKILLIFASTPLAANTVIIAGELKLNPSKAALAVLLTTIFALIYIPLIIQIL